MLPLAAPISECCVTPPIAFVEDKRADLEAVASLLEESAAANHWTNFGPVWHRLKSHIESALQLPNDRCAIPTASGTHALNAAAALAARQDEIRWVASSFGFRATVIGPFADAAVIDCDKDGLIDLDLLSTFEDGSYQGIVATNPFGILVDMNDAVAFARRNDKALVLDNAAAFVGFDRSDNRGVFECLSFHHTKPYGMGEGGCLIIDRALEADAKTALDFGYKWTWASGQAALSNGKLSDPAAAFILVRQRNDGAWADRYREQFRRVAGIGQKLGYSPLIDLGRVGSGAYGNVPLLCARPISLETIENGFFKLQKYYKPLGDGPVSHDLYARIVNVPSHPGLECLSDEELEEVLASIQPRAYAA